MLIYGALYLISKFIDSQEEDKPLKKIEIDTRRSFQPPQNPNPYSLAELQNHLDNYRRKAIENGGRDKWKYGRDYERYIGYLWEKNGWKVKYNGATKGNYDGGIDLICTKNDEVCLIQCKRWKNRVGVEEIKQFQAAIERYEEFETDSSDVEGFFYSTSGYTDDAYEVAEWNDIECCTEKFNSVKEYPPVKCINSHGSKIYFLPFDKNFDRVPENLDHLDCYKFTVADAERAGYHYHLNSGIVLKVPPPKITKNVECPQPQNKDSNFYWNGDKNYPVGFYHAGFAEFVDLKSCKIISYKEDETGGAYILSAGYIKFSPFQKGYVENTRVFRYYKGFSILPEVQMINRWVTIPAHDEESKRVALEFPLSYIEKYLPYEYEMFKIVHFKIFGEEYTDDFKSNKIIESAKFQVEKNIPYWNGDKNYPVGYYHAGYFEYINLKSCKITSYINGEYTFSAKFISVVQNSVVRESTRIFRYGRGLPKIYKNDEWIVIPKYREFKNGEGYLNYIDIQMLYSYTMFKIVHYKLLGKEYTDTCKYGWHYDKGYPEYR